MCTVYSMQANVKNSRGQNPGEIFLLLVGHYQEEIFRVGENKSGILFIFFCPPFTLGIPTVFQNGSAINFGVNTW